MVDGAAGSSAGGAVGLRRVDLLLRGLSAGALEQVLRQGWRLQVLRRLQPRSGASAG